MCMYIVAIFEIGGTLSTVSERKNVEFIYNFIRTLYNFIINGVSKLIQGC